MTTKLRDMQIDAVAGSILDNHLSGDEARAINQSPEGWTLDIHTRVGGSPSWWQRFEQRVRLTDTEIARALRTAHAWDDNIKAGRWPVGPI